MAKPKPIKYQFKARRYFKAVIHYSMETPINDLLITDKMNILIKVIEKFKIKPKLYRIIGLEYIFNNRTQKELNTILN